MSSRAGMAFSLEIVYIIIHCCFILQSYWSVPITIFHTWTWFSQAIFYSWTWLYKLTTNCCVVTIIAIVKLKDSYSK